MCWYFQNQSLLRFWHSNQNMLIIFNKCIIKFKVRIIQAKGNGHYSVSLFILNFSPQHHPKLYQLRFRFTSLPQLQWIICCWVAPSTGQHRLRHTAVSQVTSFLTDSINIARCGLRVRGVRRVAAPGGGAQFRDEAGREGGLVPSLHSPHSCEKCSPWEQREQAWCHNWMEKFLVRLTKFFVPFRPSSTRIKQWPEQNRGEQCLKSRTLQ